MQINKKITGNKKEEQVEEEEMKKKIQHTNSKIKIKKLNFKEKV